MAKGQYTYLTTPTKVMGGLALLAILSLFVARALGAQLGTGDLALIACSLGMLVISSAFAYRLPKSKLGPAYYKANIYVVACFVVGMFVVIVLFAWWVLAGELKKPATLLLLVQMLLTVANAMLVARGVAGNAYREEDLFPKNADRE